MRTGLMWQILGESMDRTQFCLWVRTGLTWSFVHSNFCRTRTGWNLGTMKLQVFTVWLFEFGHMGNPQWLWNETVTKSQWWQDSLIYHLHLLVGLQESATTPGCMRGSPGSVHAMKTPCQLSSTFTLETVFCNWDGVYVHLQVCGISIFFKDYFMCMGVLPGCMCVHHMCARYPRGPEKNIRLPGTWVTDGYLLQCGCWESNPGSLEEQPGHCWTISLVLGNSIF